MFVCSCARACSAPPAAAAPARTARPRRRAGCCAATRPAAGRPRPAPAPARHPGTPWQIQTQPCREAQKPRVVFVRANGLPDCNVQHAACRPFGTSGTHCRQPMTSAKPPIVEYFVGGQSCSAGLTCAMPVTCLPFLLCRTPDALCGWMCRSLSFCILQCSLSKILGLLRSTCSA